jgi:hypothetical protein
MAGTRRGTTFQTDIRSVKSDYTCCKHCTKGQPCGNTCISAKRKCKSSPSLIGGVIRGGSL